MGSSILLGGLSTFLGVVPLAFSSNEVNKIVFTSFFAMVALGLGHGLIFLPVVLSLVGPTNTRPRVHSLAGKGIGKEAKDAIRTPFWGSLLQKTNKTEKRPPESEVRSN